MKVPKNLQCCRNLGPVLGPAVSVGSWRPHSEAPNLERIDGRLRNRRSPLAAARAPAVKTTELAAGPVPARPSVLQPRVRQKCRRPQLLAKAGGRRLSGSGAQRHPPSPHLST